MRLILGVAVLLSCAAYSAPGASQGGAPRQPGTMILLDVGNDGFAMTSAAEGVRFDLDADGEPEQISWTAKDSDDGILALDANGNGVIDSGREVVGRYFRLSEPWAAATGADALIHELQNLPRGAGSGRGGAGQIDKNDAAYGRLVVWTDRNHDGKSAASEVAPVSKLGITAILTSFGRPKEGTPKSIDSIGNRVLFEGSFRVELRGVEFPRPLSEREPLRVK